MDMVLDASAHTAPKSRRRQVSEERILLAATQLLLERGYDGLNMKDVADAADYTPGALYRYFPSKSALLTRVLSQLIGRLGDELTALELAPGDHTSLARIVALCLCYRRFAAQQVHAFALFSSMLADPRILLPDEDDRVAIVAAMHRALMPMARQLDLAAQRSELSHGPAETRVLMLFTALHGALQLGKQERLSLLPVATDTLVRSLLHALLTGLGAPSDDVSLALDAGQALLSTIHPQVMP
ncbi:MAG: TetR/AcrR family transcriptional regulator [Sandaracinaceae bacterium]|nr:TetR/AcrR family transcriptional regulator [Sandaracinaceae bacterium]